MNEENIIKNFFCFLYLRWSRSRTFTPASAPTGSATLAVGLVPTYRYLVYGDITNCLKASLSTFYRYMNVTCTWLQRHFYELPLLLFYASIVFISLRLQCRMTSVLRVLIFPNAESAKISLPAFLVCCSLFTLTLAQTGSRSLCTR